MQGCTILPLCSYWQSEPQPLRTRRPTSSSILQNGFPRFSIATASPVASSRLSTPSIRGAPSARWPMNSGSVDRRHQPMLSAATASLSLQQARCTRCHASVRRALRPTRWSNLDMARAAMRRRLDRYGALVDWHLALDGLPAVLGWQRILAKASRVSAGQQTRRRRQHHSL